MSRDNVQTEILEPMQATYLPPRQMDEGAQKAALVQYMVALENFEREDLKTAWREVVASHMTRAWPVPGVIVLAARKARKDRLPSDARSQRDDKDNFTKKRLAWESVRASAFAIKATEMGVAWSLKTSVLYDGLKPEQIDLRRLRYAKDQAERTKQRIENGEVLHHFKDDRRLGVMQEPERSNALRMWNNILVKEEETAGEIRRNQFRGAA